MSKILFDLTSHSSSKGHMTSSSFHTGGRPYAVPLKTIFHSRAGTIVEVDCPTLRGLEPEAVTGKWSSARDLTNLATEFPRTWTIKLNTYKFISLSLLFIHVMILIYYKHNDNMMSKLCPVLNHNNVKTLPPCSKSCHLTLSTKNLNYSYQIIILIRGTFFS